MSLEILTDSSRSNSLPVGAGRRMVPPQTRQALGVVSKVGMVVMGWIVSLGFGALLFVGLLISTSPSPSPSPLRLYIGA
jgi:hypothetical protein